MELSSYVETLRDGLLAAAAAGGEESRRSAGLLAIALEPAARLALMDALSAAAAEITAALDDVRVEIHLRGREPDVVVVAERPAEPVPAESDEGTARVTLRLPETLKARVERAATEQSVSVNNWLVRAISRGLETPTRRVGRTLSGYTRG